MDEKLRRSELAAIHCAKKDLGLDDDTYRELLRTVAGVDSSKDLDAAGRRKVIERMRASGAKKFKGRPHNIDTKAQLTKVEALLADQGLAWGYADGIAKRMFRVDKVLWCDETQLQAVITALVKKQQRDGSRKAEEAAKAREAQEALEGAKDET